MARTRLSTDHLNQAGAQLREVQQLLSDTSETAHQLALLSSDQQWAQRAQALIPSLSQEVLSTTAAELSLLTEEIAHLSLGCGDVAERLLLAGRHIDETEGRLEQLFRGLREAVAAGVSSPVLVAALRGFSQRIDLVAAGVVNGPTGLFWQLFRGKPGPDYTAQLLAKVTGSNRMDAPGLAISRVATGAVRPPRSLADLAQRVPMAQAGQPQVRIERFGQHDDTTWVVYSSGTIDMSLNAPGEPWDLSSNLNAMASGTSESILATERAMNQAGIEPGSHVIHVGFSQGGLVAAHLALNNESSSASLITFGAPVAHLDFATLDRVVLVEHLEDMVPALSGEHPVTGDGRVIVTASSLEAADRGAFFPAHDLEKYEETIRLAELRARPDLASAQADLLGRLSGPGVMTTWRADRDHPG